jgi:hypothetical protein
VQRGGGSVTVDEFVAKVEWEGGIEPALDYGLKEDDIPDEAAELKAAWKELREAWASLPIRRVQDALEAHGYNEE